MVSELVFRRGIAAIAYSEAKKLEWGNLGLHWKVLTLFLLGLNFLTLHFVTQVSVHIFSLKRSLGSAQFADRGCLSGASSCPRYELDFPTLDTFGGLVVFGKSPVFLRASAPL